METKKYILEIKLKREKFSRWYYDKTFKQFSFLIYEFIIETNSNASHCINYKDIDYFRIIPQ